MRNIFIPLGVALVLGTSGMAFAATVTTPATKPVAGVATVAQSATGTIRSLDLATHLLTLDNGIAYVLPATFKDPGLKVGEKVTVKWQMNGKAYDATSVTIG